ncbi:hypothetical protein [Edaphocola aurantiacus]|uniref:hypothetical protein n=1 Tax=Edaphocola aurantiacus TaxID=2601682 RepID=UPI001C98B4F6|nr:hypothetical protein [Edaphocola aurantiacus]
MKKSINVSRSAGIVGLVTLLLLAIPFIAMQFTAEVNWGVGDFLIMGALIFSTGMAYVLLSSSMHIIFKLAAAMAVGTTFLMIWANLAAGLIGAGPNAANLMFIAVVFILIFGSVRSGFTASGMEKSMYATALSLAVLAVIALLGNMDQYPGTSAKEIIGICGFFAGLYAIAGALFHYAGKGRTVQGI